MSDADLSDADLSGADMSNANMSGARLNGAYLGNAKLHGADLRNACLYGADLHGADLHNANLHIIHKDLEAVLAAAPTEVQGLLDMLQAGRIDGLVYRGECACLVGTIANLRHEPYTAMTCGLRPNNQRPAEIWFLAIKQRDTPETNPVATITAKWIEEWIVKHKQR
jgi:Pentapeptide repeats (8 copies)